MWGTGPTRKLSLTSSRVVDVAETERRVRAVQSLVPITRVSDLTPLDPLRVPVFVAVTPLARDLTTHAGKGADAQCARVSAMMEAIERVSAESAPAESLRRACFRELASSALDPRAFDLPGDSSYRDDAELAWMRSYDALGDRELWIAEDLAISPPRSGVLREVDTNGLASGNTQLEAAVHGLCEVIERDVLSQLEFATLFGEPHEAAVVVRTLDPCSVPDGARALIERIRSQDLQVVVQSLETDVAVPTCRTVVIDAAYPSSAGPVARYFPGFGTHPNAEVALMRSITEALQSRIGFIHGGRDSFNTLPAGTRASTAAARAASLRTAPDARFEQLPSVATLDLAEDLQFLLAQLERAGFAHVVVSDLTRREWAFPVVRVRVPGMASFLVNRRRVGWRCLRQLV
jgi:ribosomal protein S12 methylthiotransferase accessory factor